MFNPRGKNRTETVTQMREVPEGAAGPLPQRTGSDPDSRDGDRHDGSERSKVMSQPGPPRQRPWLKMLPEVAALGLCVVLWIPTKEFTSSVGGPGPAMYPRALIALLGIAMIVRMGQQLREHRAGVSAGHEADEAPIEEGVEFDESLIDSRRVWVAIAFSILYVLSTLYLGWLIATFIFTIIFLVLAGKRNPLIVLPIAFTFAFGFSYVFVKIVYISLPTGVGAFDLLTVRLFELLGIY